MRHAHLDAALAYAASELGLAATTIVAYRGDLVRFAAYVRRRGGKLDQVSLENIQGFIQRERRHDIADATLYRRVSAVRLLLRFQRTLGRDVDSIISGIELPPPGQRQIPDVLSLAQVNQLIDVERPGYAHQVRDVALLEILYSTGMRASEVCAMKLRDMNLESKWIRVMGKGSKERIVRLHDGAVAAVRKYLALQRPAEAEHVFLSHTGKPLDRTNLYLIVKKAQAAAGIKAKVSPHVLRHSFGSHMLGGGADLRTIQELLGHSDVSTTQIYTKVDFVHLKKMHSLHPRH